MRPNAKRLPAHFYALASGPEPLHDWLRELGKPDSELIGKDIRIVEFGWPIDMPTCGLKGKACLKCV